MTLSKTFDSNKTRFGRPASSQTSVVHQAPEGVRALAEELGFETDNLQIRIAYQGRVLYAHDYVHGTQSGMNALQSFDTAQVIDGTDLATPKYVSPDDTDLPLLKDRVHAWKKAWTPHEVLKIGGIRNMTDLLNDSGSQGAVLNPAVPG